MGARSIQPTSHAAPQSLRNDLDLSVGELRRLLDLTEQVKRSRQRLRFGAEGSLCESSV